MGRAFVRLCPTCVNSLWHGERQRLECMAARLPVRAYHCPDVSECRAYGRAPGSDDGTDAGRGISSGEADA